jgi:hypothetical protein
MTTTPRPALPVMLVESKPGVGEAHRRALQAAGHRVYRCNEPGSRSFPCNGMLPDGECPLDVGAKVALLVRDHVDPRSSPYEVGVRCAARAGLPVIEAGPELLDPFESTVTTRVPVTDIAAAVDAVERAEDPLIADIRARLHGILRAVGIDPGAFECRLVYHFPRMHVVLEGPPVGCATAQAMSVRVLDAVRASARTYGTVDVSVVAKQE